MSRQDGLRPGDGAERGVGGGAEGGMPVEVETGAAAGAGTSGGADPEARVRDALGAVRVPPEVARRTLARIEAERAAAEAGGGAGQVAKPATASPTPASPRRTRRPARQTSRRSHRLRLVLAAAAALVAVALVGVGAGAWLLLPSAYVAIDVNPSVELGVNRLDRVASVRAANADGERLLEAADVEGMGYEDALDALDAELARTVPADAPVELTIVCDEPGRADELARVGEGCLGGRDGGADAGGRRVICSHASHHEREAALEAGMGLGKYRIYLQLVEAGVDISAEDAATMTVRELLDLAAESGGQAEGGTAADAGGRASGTASHDGGHGAATGDGHRGRGPAADTAPDDGTGARHGRGD